MVWLLTQDEFFLFKHPFRCYIAGPTYSGKTKLIEKILLYREEIIDTRFDRIVLCYKAMQPTYEIFSYMDIDIELHEGLIKTSEFDPKMKNLVIIDDLMEECKDSKEILNLFTVDSHHKGISVFLVSQSIYTKGKCSWEINLNSSNMIIFGTQETCNKFQFWQDKCFQINQKLLWKHSTMQHKMMDIHTFFWILV